MGTPCTFGAGWHTDSTLSKRFVPGRLAEQVGKPPTRWAATLWAWGPARLGVVDILDLIVKVPIDMDRGGRGAMPASPDVSSEREVEYVCPDMLPYDPGFEGVNSFGGTDPRGGLRQAQMVAPGGFGGWW